MLNGARTFAMVALGAAVVAAGCDAILGGGDYRVVPAAPSGGSGGTTATGGSGGSTGGAGGGAQALPYECAWQLPSHQIVASLELAPEGSRRWDSKLHPETANDELRLFVYRPGPTIEACEVDVFTHSASSSDADAFGASGLHDVKRIDDDRIIALTSTLVDVGSGGGPAVMSPQLHGRVFLNYGATSTDIALTTDQALADTHGGEEALIAPAGNGQGSDLGDLPFYITYEDETLRRHAAFGVYSGTPIAPTQLFLPSQDPPDAQVQPAAMVYAGGKSYVLAGSGDGGGTGVFMYVLPQPAPVEPRVLADATAVPTGLVLAGDDFNVGGAEMAAMPFSVRLLLGRLPLSQLETFTWTDLAEAGHWSSPDEMPIDMLENMDIRWVGNTQAFLGTPPSNADELVIMFYDVSGQSRGVAHLPLSVDIEPGGVRTYQSATVFPMREGFDFAGGDLHVAWIEEHQTASTPAPYQVLFYDVVRCSVVSPD